MTTAVTVPALPESVADATLINWTKKPGDPVRAGENLVDLETDKVVLELPAPVSGILKQILAQDGTTVTSGDTIAYIEEGEVADHPHRGQQRQRPREPAGPDGPDQPHDVGHDQHRPCPVMVRHPALRMSPGFPGSLPAAHSTEY